MATSDETADGGTRAAAWVARVEQVKAFVRDVGRLPARTAGGMPSSEHERSLFYWLRQQRKREERLAEWQWQRLDAMEWFEWVPRDSAWARRLEEYEAFFTGFGRPPRTRGKGAEERSLGRWMERQMQAERRGTLAAPRRFALRSSRRRLRRPITNPDKFRPELRTSDLPAAPRGI